MASANYAITTTWTAYGSYASSKINIENTSGVVAEYATGTSAPSASFVGGRLINGGGPIPVDLKASESLYLRIRPNQGATSTTVFVQDAT